MKEDNDNFRGFCAQYKDRYWNETTQNEIESKPEFGYYSSAQYASTVSYSTKMFREVEGLTPSIPSQELIPNFAKYFSEEIRMAILGGPITKLNGLLEFLERSNKSGP